MNKGVKNKQKDDKQVNGILLNLLSVSLTFIVTIGTSMYSLGKIQNRIETIESEMKKISIELTNYEDKMGAELLEINKLNGKIIEDKLYIFQKYNDYDERKRLLDIINMNYNDNLKKILNDKSTD